MSNGVKSGGMNPPAPVVIVMDNQTDSVPMNKSDPYYKESNSNIFLFFLLLNIARISRWEDEAHSKIFTNFEH